VSLDLRFERLIAAAPERVFDAFTDPVGQRELYGQDAAGWIVDSRCDLRVGGVWSVSFGPSPDELYHHRHVFEMIDRPRRILIASTETRPDGSSFETTLEFTFEPRGGSTHGLPEPQRLELISSNAYADGCVTQVFRPA
jgi:uncharacterized protein YndB with AHSA1/START domain